MNRVSLISTVHGEMERANVAELHSILATLQPEVIFLEVPAAAFASHFVECSEQNLESLAVREYRAAYPIKLVPVDLPTPQQAFFDDHAHLHRRVWEESIRFRQLLETDVAYVKRYGFAYLNSEHNNQIWVDIYEEMLNTIQTLGEPRLVEIYRSWKEKMELRDTEMMRGVLEYCSQHTFERGAFLVGAAHRQRIAELALEQSAANSAWISWDFPSCQFS